MFYIVVSARFDKNSGNELTSKGVTIKLHKCKLATWRQLDVLCNAKQNTYFVVRKYTSKMRMAKCLEHM